MYEGCFKQRSHRYRKFGLPVATSSTEEQRNKSFSLQYEMSEDLLQGGRRCHRLTNQMERSLEKLANRGMICVIPHSAA